MKRLPILSVLAAAALSAQAGEHRYGPLPPVYVQECGSCHVPYPPTLMTAPGWADVMKGLERHFGVDASLEPTIATAVADYLQRAASRRDKHAAAVLPARLSQTPWFRREHGELPVKATAKLPAAAQCESCHTAAERGDYRESGLRLPAGYRHREK